MKTYTVLAGDTLYGISKQFGVSVEDIRNANNLKDNNIYVGQNLKIPISSSGSEIVYTVKKGDSLYAIAKKYGVGVNELMTLNKLSNTNLSIGQILIIPSSDNSNYFNYIVQKGDSLYSIAQKYNTTVNAIKNLNSLSSNLLNIGQVLKIPKSTTQNTGGEYQIYIVKKGDTLYSIANAFNMSVNELKSINNLSSNLLNIGQVLKVKTSSIDELPTEIKECFGTGYVEPTYQIYTVKKGDSLYVIAKKFNTSVENLMKLNNLDSSSLQIGQKLKIRELR